VCGFSRKKQAANSFEVKQKLPFLNPSHFEMYAVDVCSTANTRERDCNEIRTTEIRVKNRDVLLAKAVLVSILFLVAGLSAQSQSPESKPGQWRIAGQNLNNTWSQPAEHSISPANVKS